MAASSRKDRPDIDHAFNANVRARSWLFLCHEQPDWPVAAHDMFEFAWVDTGELDYSIGSRRLVVPAGSALLVPSGVEHKTRVNTDTRAGSVWLGQHLVAQVRDALGLAGNYTFQAEQLVNRRAADLGRMLVDTARQNKPGQSLLANALAEALVVEMLQNHAKPMRPSGAVLDPRIAKAVAHVEAAFAEPLGVDELARTAGMSRFHFSRMFKAQVGTSPHQFITQQRIAQAARLLRAGRYSVTEVAMRVGMSELGRFSQVFRRQLGCSPSDFYRSFR